MNKQNSSSSVYQYKYLASFVKMYQAEYPIVALGVEKLSKDETGGLTTAIRLFGKLTPDLKIDPKTSEKNAAVLLGGFNFPIINTTELEMQQNIAKWGYESVMRNIWFCHKPIRGEACGLCNPCLQKQLSGVSSLLSENAIRRHELFDRIEQKYGHFGKKVAEFFYRLVHWLGMLGI